MLELQQGGFKKLVILSMLYSILYQINNYSGQKSFFLKLYMNTSFPYLTILTSGFRITHFKEYE